MTNYVCENWLIETLGCICKLQKYRDVGAPVLLRPSFQNIRSARIEANQEAAELALRVSLVDQVVFGKPRRLGHQASANRPNLHGLQIPSVSNCSILAGNLKELVQIVMSDNICQTSRRPDSKHKQRKTLVLDRSQLRLTCMQHGFEKLSGLVRHQDESARLLSWFPISCIAHPRQIDNLVRVQMCTTSG